MDMLGTDQGPKLDSDGKIVSRVPEETRVRFVVFERYMFDTISPADSFCRCGESGAYVDHGELAVPPDAIALAAERLSDTLDRGAKVRRVEVLKPVDRKVLFA